MSTEAAGHEASRDQVIIEAYHSEPGPIQQLAESFGSISLNDPLPTRHPAKVVEVLKKCSEICDAATHWIQ